MLREEACLGLTDRKTQIYRNSKRKITLEKGEGEEKKKPHKSSRIKMVSHTRFGPVRHIIC